MTYSVKQAEQTVPQNETKNPPDAKPADWRSPWKGAAIGGTLGGLITTALGYLYGHRGRWLAYDAIAGGGTGAAVGYGVDAHNNAKALERGKPLNALDHRSKAGQRAINAKADEQFVADHGKDVEAWEKINAEGGFDLNPRTAGVWGAYKNLRQKNTLKARGAHIKDPKEALAHWKRNKTIQGVSAWGGVPVASGPVLNAIWGINKLRGYNP